MDTDSVGLSPQIGVINHKTDAMKALSAQTVLAYHRRMGRVGVRVQERAGYLRWVRFSLDFCQKYELPPRAESSIAPFLAKLASKQQSEAARG